MKLRLGALAFSALAASLLFAPLAQSQTAILGDTNGFALVFPNVTFTGSCPATVPSNTVTGITGTPHGVAYYGSDFALISSFGGSQVFNVQISTHAVLNTISTTTIGYNGQSSIAVAPSLQFAVMATGGTAYAMAAPFSSPTFTSVALPGSVASYQTMGIVFNSTNRAFIATSGGIAVLDPPYTSVAFTIPGAAEGIAISPDGNTILTTGVFNNGSVVRIFTGPFSSSSTPVNLTIAGTTGLDGITFTPDGSRALVVDGLGSQAFIYSIAAPYTASSTVDNIPIPAGSGALEDVTISADGNFLLATGNSGAVMPFIRAPFTASGATSCGITVANGGRGAGAVRFLPVSLQPPIGPPPASLPVPTLSEWALAALGLLLALTTYVTLRRRGH
jgi:hypothetical protein